MKSCKNLSENNTYLKSENCKNIVVKHLWYEKKQVHKININNAKKQTNRKRGKDCLKYVCWIIVPILTFTLVLLDALNIYSFNKERLIVIDVCLLVILLPFFNEITLKNLSVKRSNSKNENDD